MSSVTNFIITYYIQDTRGKESIKVRITQNKGKESENSYQKLKKSLQDRHTKPHGNLNEIFRWTLPSFSIRRERMYMSTQQDMIQRFSLYTLIGLYKINKQLTYLITSIVFPLYNYFSNAKHVVNSRSIPPKPSLILSYNFI